MKKRLKRSIVAGCIIILLIVTGIIIWQFKQRDVFEVDDIIPKEVVTIKHLEAFDSFDGELSMNSLKGDFQWESTSYQYTDGIGRIYGYWCNGNPRFGNCITASMPVKIEELDLDKVTKDSCESIKYGLDSEFNSHQNRSESSTDISYSIPVKDKEIICFSLDKNRDGIMGDEFIAVKIISHIDSSEESYAESMTFQYKILE